MNKFFAHQSAIIDDYCMIGDDTKIWHFSHIMSNCTIGAHCNIGQNVVISPFVKIGNFVKVQNNVSIYTGVECEDYVFLGPSMVFTNILNPRSKIVRKEQYLSTKVRYGASVGANATIICGIEIGKFAMIGAGTVVTKDVKPYSLVIGNPGRHKGWVSEYGHKLVFDKENKAVCEESGEEYSFENDAVTKI